MQQVEEAEDWRRARGEGCCEHPRQRRRRRRAQPRVLNREHLASGCSSYPVNINKNNEDGRLMRSLLMLVLVLMLRRAATKPPASTRPSSLSMGMGASESTSNIN